jgi:hypothetical protein
MKVIILPMLAKGGWGGWGVSFSKDDRKMSALCKDSTTTSATACLMEPVFLNLLRSPGIDSQPGGIDS